MVLRADEDAADDVLNLLSARTKLIVVVGTTSVGKEGSCIRRFEGGYQPMTMQAT